MAGKAPAFTFSTRVTTPAIGLGVFQSGPNDTIAAVRGAITAGYLEVDLTAMMKKYSHVMGEL
jgi:2,5-diketo-D-gluconate reductase A